MKLHLMNDTAYATDKVPYISTSSYISDSSDYVSSVVNDDTPFPSLTKSKKAKILESIRASTFDENIVENINEVNDEVNDEPIVEPITENIPEPVDIKNSCCSLF